MSDNTSIPRAVVSGIKQLGEETVKEAVGEGGKILTGVISAKELLGDISDKSMGETELAQKKIEEDKKAANEISELRQQMGLGRDVEKEIEIVKREKEEVERNKEEEVYRQIEAEREYQRQAEMAALIPETPAHKRKKKRGGAFAKGKQGQASTSDMSATAEYFKKPD